MWPLVPQTIGQDLPIFIDTPSGVVNATAVSDWEPLSTEMRTPTTTDELRTAQRELESLGNEEATAVIALSADPMLWACALTGLEPEDLVCLEANEGA